MSIQLLGKRSEQIVAVLLLNKPEKKDNVLWLSVSKVKTFENCKKQFYFSYIEKLPKKEYDYTIYGKFLHEVLEKFHKIYIAGSLDPFHIAMGTAFKDAMQNWKEKLTSEQIKEGKKTLTFYLQELATAEKNKTLPKFISAEQEFYVDIDGKVLLNGFIDRVQIDPDGVLHISDYKTSKSMDFLKKDLFQLKVYAYIMCLADIELTKIRTSYIMLKHDMKLIVKEFTRDEVLEIENYFLEKAALIGVEEAYPEKPSPLCIGCSWLENCYPGNEFLEKIGKKKNHTNIGKMVGWDKL